MASQIRRTPFVRLAVGAAALAIPLLAAGSAVAAMGGAIPLTSTLRPDLRTVTLVSSNAAQFCFDKTLSQGPALVNSNFALGGYNPARNTTAGGPPPFVPPLAGTEPVAGGVAYDLSNTSCVDAVYPSGPDYNQYTYGSVGEHAVSSLTGGNFNRADSTALTGSTTNNGTTGNTVAPDLTGVNVNATFNTVNYVFNKNVGNTPAPGSFSIVDAGGNLCAGDLLSGVSGNTVTIHFPTAVTIGCPVPFVVGPNDVGTAVRARVDVNTVRSLTQGGETNPDLQVAIVPGTPGTTARPDLVSALLEPSGGVIDYNFDQPIGSAPAVSFGVVLADGKIATGSSATITNTATTGTVRVTFANGANFNEYDVKASVTRGSVALGGVTALNGGAFSTAGSVPVGDNAGAFARGFTSGADAVQTTFNTQTGDATVTFDQRVFTDTASIAAGFVLLDANGTPLVSGTGQTVTIVPAAAGPMQVMVHFNLSQPAMALAKSLEICGPPDNVFGALPGSAANVPPECATGLATAGSVFTSNLGAAPNEPNVQQILSPFAVSAKLIKQVTVWAPKHANKHAKKHSRHTKVRKHRSHKR